MATKIKLISEDLYSVNGKLVYKDTDGKWIGSQEMTTQEVSHFQSHIIKITDAGT